jgi:release factor glutamine methyltransferase
VNGLLRDAVERLRSAGIESSRAEARLLWECAEAADVGFETLLQRRLAHEPIAYITGHKEFWSLDFEVGPGVLIPRPETETLVEQALRELPDATQPYRILDLGTGSACLLVALLKELPNATGTGIDSSEAALSWANRNTTHHGMSGRCELLESDWAGTEGAFDLIVSNPPYIPSRCIAGLPPDVRNYEPRESLDGGPDGLDAYRALMPVLSQNLKGNGLALLEIGVGQHHMVRNVLENQGLTVGRIEPDLGGIPRCVVVRRPAGER